MLNLIPAPRGSVHMQEGSVKLPETVIVSLGDFAPWCLEAFAARLDGHVEIAESAPAVCPVCMHPQAYFQVKAENY